MKTVVVTIAGPERRMDLTVPAETPWTAPNARELDSQTFHTWLKKACAYVSRPRITWLGHSTFVMTSPKGVRVLFDPFVTNNPSCPPATSEYKPGSTPSSENTPCSLTAVRPTIHS